MPDIAVTRRPGALRYDITLDGEPAGFTQYADRRGVRTFLHTEIDDAFEGHGLASTLIHDALEDTRAHGMTIVPRCPFVRSYVARHPEVADLLAPGVTVPDEEENR